MMVSRCYKSLELCTGMSTRENGLCMASYVVTNSIFTFQARPIHVIGEPVCLLKNHRLSRRIQAIIG